MNITDWRVLAVFLGFILVLVFFSTGKVDKLMSLLLAFLGHARGEADAGTRERREVGGDVREPRSPFE